MSDLPEGFVLDPIETTSPDATGSPALQNDVALPDGFVLDEPASPAISAPADGTQDDDRLHLGRSFLAGVQRGVIDLAGLPVDTVANVGDLVRAAIGTGATVAGRPDLAPEIPDRSDVVGTSDWIAKQLGRTGAQMAPTDPESGAERTAFAFGRGASSAAAGAPEAIAGNAIRGGIGAVAGQVVGEATDNPTLGIAANLAAGRAPEAGAAVTRGAARGGQASAAAAQERVADFDRLGVDPTLAQAKGQRGLIAGAESVLAKTPGSSGVMQRKAEKTQQQLGSAVESITDSLAPKSGVAHAGRSIEDGITGPGGFVDQFRSQSRKLYDEVDRHIAPDTAAPVSNTQKALSEMTEPIKGALATSELLANPKLTSIKAALDQDLAAAKAKGVPPAGHGAFGPIYTGFKGKANEAVQHLAAMKTGEAPGALSHPEVGDIDVVWGRPPNGADQGYGLAKIIAKHPEVANDLQGFISRLKKDPKSSGENRIRLVDDTGKAVVRLDWEGSKKQWLLTAFDKKGAGSGTTTGTATTSLAGDTASRKTGTGSSLPQGQAALPYEALKELRTKVGSMISNPSLTNDIPTAQLKKLYGALSSDMESAARKSGQEAYRAFTRAQNYYKAGQGRIEQLDRVVSKAGGPEAIFNAAMNGTKDGASRVQTVMKSLPLDARRIVSATVLERMGKATPGRQDATGSTFSTDTFLTNFNRLSPEAQRVLFESHGMGYVQDLRALARIADNLKQGSKVFANPSGTASTEAAIGTYGGLGGAIATGRMDVAAGIGAGLAATNIGARFLTNPRAVRWLVKTTKLPDGARRAELARMAASTRQEDEDMHLIAQRLMQSELNDGPESPQQPEN